ncbi:restriction endonuclease subunit S [Sinorhizobium chiapasense]|uniref:Restriction endonuclease subunit S n=1 Tax=Sinorhizobium chiapasense TaxID=501572 RepID=A0ABZ2BC33_9HYPH
MSAQAYPHYKRTGVDWPPEVPSTWEMRPVKRLSTLVYGDALPSDVRDETGEVPVYGSNGAFGKHSEANTSAPAILVGRKGSYGALNWSDVPSFAIDTVYYVDPPHSKCNLRWLYWAFHTANFGTLSQDTGVPGLSREAAYEVRLPYPSKSEQAAIAAFLDLETAKIDALVEEQKRLIELLKEKRQAVISHAVTKGLNPNVSLKDTGIEWLREAPEHWELVQLKRCLRSVDYGISDTLGPEGAVAILRMGNIQDGRIDLGDLKFVDAVDSALLLDRGDLLYNRTNSLDQIGKVGLYVPGDLQAVSFASYLVRLRTSPDCCPDFFAYALNTEGILGVARARAFVAIGQCNLNPSRYSEIVVAKPPLAEQIAIVEHLRRATSALDELRDQAEKSVTLLQERRLALISAAVTGKVDVRGLVDIEDAA